MRRTLLTISCSLLLVAAVFFSSCTKEGPAGAAGATGPAGPAGPQGAAGATGPAGAPGTANVIYSNWLDVTFTGGSDTTFWDAEISAPKLVDSILNRGMVKVYLNLSSTPTTNPVIVPLPYVDMFSGIQITPYFSRQTIALESSTNASTRTQNGVKILQYRYVLIPGGTTSGRTAIDWNNYAAVKKYLGLKD